MKSISSFMAEITDELRIVLVEALRSLCLKFPHKHSTLMAFLSSVLREEGKSLASLFYIALPGIHL